MMPAIPDPIAEVALAHLVRHKVIGLQANLFLGMRRELLTAWENRHRLVWLGALVFDISNASVVRPAPSVRRPRIGTTESDRSRNQVGASDISLCAPSKNESLNPFRPLSRPGSSNIG